MMRQGDSIQKIIPAEYEKVSVLSRIASTRLLERLQWMAVSPEIIINLGSATGQSVQALKQQYPSACVIGLDWSQSMLQFARQAAVSTSYGVCALAECLPLRSGIADLIFANLILPWCRISLEWVLLEWKRILKPNGLLMLTCYGPDTLKELNSERLVPYHFIDMHNLGDLLMQVGFEGPVLDIDHFILRYRTYREQQYELWVNGFIANEIALRDAANSLELSYEVIFAHAWRPHQLKNDAPIATFPLEALRKQLRGPV